MNSCTKYRRTVEPFRRSRWACTAVFKRITRRSGCNDAQVSSAGGLRVMVLAQPHFSSLLAVQTRTPRFAACLDAGMATPMAPAALSNISSLQNACVQVLPRPNPARRPSFSSQYISVHDCSRIITKALSSLDHARKPHTSHTAASFQHLSRRINALD